MSDLDKVKQIIPHREPFLFVDRIVEQGEDRIVTERKVRPDEPHFEGHYPGSPLMPGVLLCEACFQTGAMLLSSAGFQPAPDAGVPPASSFQGFTGITKKGRGYLPHWEREGATYFVTFRLADSIPADAQKRIDTERRNITSTAEQLERPLTESEREKLDRLYSGTVDELLNAGHGACYMRDSRCAEIVADALQHFNEERYRLYAWCVMPNHVHVVFRPFPSHELHEIMHSWKSFTAKQCNAVLERTGEFWQRESFDRIVRDPSEFEKRVRYTLENPVVAGLDDWPWVGGAAAGTPTPGAGKMPALRDSGAMLLAGAGDSVGDKKPVLTRILEAKFRGMVVPGDLLLIEVEQEEKMGEAYVMNGKVSVAGKNVLRVKFVVAMIEV